MSDTPGRIVAWCDGTWVPLEDGEVPASGMICVPADTCIPKEDLRAELVALENSIYQACERMDLPTALATPVYRLKEKLCPGDSDE